MMANDVAVVTATPEEIETPMPVDVAETPMETPTEKPTETPTAVPDNKSREEPAPTRPVEQMAVEEVPPSTGGEAMEEKKVVLAPTEIFVGEKATAAPQEELEGEQESMQVKQEVGQEGGSLQGAQGDMADQGQVNPDQVEGSLQQMKAEAADDAAGGRPDERVDTPQEDEGEGEGEGAQFRPPRLNVKDALDYLGKVKLQFSNKLDVYNKFLDIMKDFKSQQIDTPGVIRSVSELFVEHPDLIVGFNTFLPAGYSVEVPDRRTGRAVMHHLTQDGVHTSQPTDQGYAQHGQHPQQHPPPAMAKHQPVAALQHNHHAQQQQQQQQQMPDEEPKKQQEYDHAIKYVNKIKTRFANNLDVYKAFLEILHTYQNEQKSINEVYAQVATLFRSHTDLLDEFSHFLPEAVPVAQAHAEGQRRAEAKRGRRAAAASAAAGAGADAAGKKPSKPEFNLDELSGHGLVTEELAFFEKIKKTLRPAHVYENFLRCLILYSNEIINMQDLVMLVDPFLRKMPELFRWFKDFIGFSEVTAAGGVDANGEPHHRDIDLSQCKRMNESYRALPASHRNMKCSGRAKLNPKIAEVINDAWVSFPTWSEDSSFVTSKKNIHEEAIFRCEDERYELDVILESNLLTIRVLEMVMYDLKNMSPTQRHDYKFDKVTLGGSSGVIHRKCVQKLWGDRAGEVIDALARDPYSHIPVVLKRLKQKHSEWRNTQRQWNQIWREINEKNYLKSLDHKSVQFKKSDPLFFKPKAIKLRLRDAREEYRKHLKMTKGAPVVNPAPPPVVVFQYDADGALFGDVEELILHDIDRTSAPDRAKLRAILCDFLPSYLGITVQRPAAASADEASADVAASTASAPTENGDAAIVPAINGTAAPVVTADAEPPSTSPSASASQMDTTEEASGEAAPKFAAGVEAADTSGEPPAKAAKRADSVSPVTAAAMNVTTAAPANASSASQQLFLGNGRWFVLHSLHQLLYDRVRVIKNLSNAVAQKHAQRGDKLAPVVALALRTPVEVPEDGYFAAFKSLTKRWLDGKVEATAYEESMRELFNTQAYITFTMDKLIHTFVKQLQSLVSDANSESLLGAYMRHQQQEEGYDYRAHAVDIQEESLIYAISLVGPRRVQMELVDADVPADGKVTGTERWVQYVNNYTKLDITDPKLAPHLVRPLFLNRNLRRVGFGGDEAKAMKNARIANNLECKFMTNAYKMYFVHNSEDYFHRSAPRHAEAAAVLPRRFAKFRAFCDQWKAANCHADEQAACVQWMVGEGDTVCVAEKVEDESHSYTRYHMKHSTEPSSQATDSGNAPEAKLAEGAQDGDASGMTSTTTAPKHAQDKEMSTEFEGEGARDVAGQEVEQSRQTDTGVVGAGAMDMAADN